MGEEVAVIPSKWQTRLRHVVVVSDRGGEGASLGHWGHRGDRGGCRGPRVNKSIPLEGFFLLLLFLLFSLALAAAQILALGSLVAAVTVSLDIDAQTNEDKSPCRYVQPALLMMPFGFFFRCGDAAFIPDLLVKLC